MAEFHHFNMTHFQKDVRLTKTPFGIFETLMIVTMGVFFILLLIIICYLKKIKSHRDLSRSEITQFFEGGGAKATKEVNVPYEKFSYELVKERFEIDEAVPLGSGAFGKVCRGRVTRAGGAVDSVAVKIPCKRAAIRGLLNEIKIISFLKRHPHIIELVGAYTAELNEGKIFVFLELCALGSLQEYLRKRKPKNTAGPEDEIVAGMPDDYQGIWVRGQLDQSLVNDLSRWSREIANGMEFIASKNIVHIDLATRNILLTCDKRAKISDFGLSRQMDTFKTYIKKVQEPLPWRWMPPESLRKSEFTEKSDVWAFGVTLWEIFELGSEPYSEISYDVNFPSKLERGLRLDEPAYNRDSMYSVMLRCWNINPELRPTFRDLLKIEALSPASIDVADVLNRVSTVPVESETSLDERSNGGSATPNYIYTVSETAFNHILDSNVSIFEIQTSQEIINISKHSDKFEEGLSHTTSAWRVAASILLLMILAILILAIVGNQNKSGMQKSDTSSNITNLLSSGQNTSSDATNFRGSVSWTEEDEGLLTMVGSSEEKVINDENKLTAAIHLLDKLRDQFKTNNTDNETFDNDKFVGDGATFLNGLVDGGYNITQEEFKDAVEYLVKNKLSYLFNDQNNTLRRTPLMLAAKNVEMDIATILFLGKNGVDLTLIDNNGSSYLSYAAEGNKNTDLLRALASIGSIKHTNLESAIEDMNGDSIKVLVRLGADVNEIFETYEDSATPLHLAADSVDKGFAINIIKFLINSGANAYAKADHRLTFLHNLVYYIEDGTPVNPAQFQEMVTFLFTNQLSLFRLFNAPNYLGSTPLHLAVKFMKSIKTETLHLLKTNGVAFNAVDEDGRSVLWYATYANQTSKLIQDLVSFGANPKHLTKQNVSMLHTSAYNGNIHLMQFFLDCELDINAENRWGNTPLHYVFVLDEGKNDKRNTFLVAQFLLKNGANAEIVDNGGKRPRDLLVKNQASFPDADKILACLSLGSSC